MSKKKIIFYSAIIIILLSFLTVGTIATVMGTSYKNNEITFVVDDVKAYCKIEGKFYYNDEEVVDSTYKPYNETYLPGSEYNVDGFEGFASWDSLPDAKFYGGKAEVYKYEIIISNLNPNFDLSVQLKNVIVGEEVATGELLFYTTISYQIDEGENVVKFSNKGDGVNLNLYQDNSLKVSLAKTNDVDNSQKISVNSKLKIAVEIERKTNTKTINGDIYTNNFVVAVDAIEQAVNS